MKENGITCAICTYNGALRIEKCLEHLAKNVNSKVAWELLVIDNGSTDGTVQLVGEYWKPFSDRVPLHVVSAPMPDIRKARMSAIDSASFDFVSYIDDDNWVPESWVDTVFGIMDSDSDVAAVGFSTKAVYDIEPPEWFVEQQQRHAIGEQIFHKQGWLWSAGLTLRKQAIKHILDCGFQFADTEGFAGRKPGSDVELTMHLTLAGWKVIYSKDLLLEHHIENTRISLDSVKNLARAQGMVHPYLEPLFAANREPLSWERRGLYWQRALVRGIVRLTKHSFSASELDQVEKTFWIGYLGALFQCGNLYPKRLADARRFSLNARQERHKYVLKP